MIEIWRDIKDYEGLYQVSNFGRVKSLCFGKEQILKPVRVPNGYLVVSLSKDRRRKRFYIHRLVAQAFIDNPNNLPIVNHKDEVKTNNFVFIREDGSVDFTKTNLEWCDDGYSVKYGTRTERAAKTNTNGKTSKCVAQKTLNGELIKIWPSAAEVHRQTGWSQGHVSECCRGEQKSAYGCLWSYIKDFLLFKSDNSNLTSLPN